MDTAKGHQLPGQPGGSPVGGGRHMCEKSRSGGGSERDGVLGRVRGGASGGHKLAPPLHTRPAPGKKRTAALLPQAPSSRPGLCSQAAAAQGQARGTPTHLDFLGEPRGPSPVPFPRAKVLVLRSESETQRKPEVPASPRGEALFRCARPSGVPRGPVSFCSLSSPLSLGQL